MKNKKSMKKSYSMTAKERKLLAQKTKFAEGNQGNEKIVSAENVAGLVAGEKTKNRKKNRCILITTIAAAVVLILTAILLPIFLTMSSSKYPVAKIKFTNGMTVRMEIWEESCPITATNFIYLARQGFFDNTLVYDVQNNFVRFGAYLTYDFKRYDDSSFIEKVKNFDISDISFENAKNNLFGYKLKADSSPDQKRSSQLGVVSYGYDKTADFVINLDEGNERWESSNEKDPTRREHFNVRSFGKIFDDDLDKVRELYAKPKNTNPGTLYYVGLADEVRIESIEISNLNSKVWNGKFDFGRYMNELTTGGAWNYWSSYN